MRGVDVTTGAMFSYGTMRHGLWRNICCVSPAGWLTRCWPNSMLTPPPKHVLSKKNAPRSAVAPNGGVKPFGVEFQKVNDKSHRLM
jgi:hypothetical protein